MTNAMKMAMWALVAVGTAFGEAYDPAVHGNPIVVTTDEALTIDGNGAVIDGGGKVRCATLGPNVTLKNFTLKRGFADCGGGVLGGRLERCVISGCTATMAGGAYGTVLTDCTVSDCQASESGAALGNCQATNCRIVRNRRPLGDSPAATHGGILFDSTLTNCELTGNVAEFGKRAPAFGGLGEGIVANGCTVRDNSIACDAGVCYGLRFAHSMIDGTEVEFDDGEGASPEPPTPPEPPAPDDPQPDPGTYEPEVEPLPGYGMVGRYFAKTYLNDLGAGLSRSYNKKTTLKAEGFPSGLKLVKSTVNGNYDYAVEGVPTEVMDGVTRIAYVRITGSDKTVRLVPLSIRVLPATTAVFPSATNKVECWHFPVVRIWPGYEGHEKNWTFSGWPTGIKFASKDTKYGGRTVKAGRIYGKPTKVGTFTVKAMEKVSGTSYKNTHLATFTVLYGDGAAPPVQPTKPTPDFDLAVGGLHETEATIKDIQVGVAYEWAISNTPFATVSASGLPSGLSLKSTSVKDPSTRKTYKVYRVAGVPTKAGCFFVTFTVKLNGVTAKRTFAFCAEGLPVWAQGTFDGGADELFAVGGQATFTVSKAGKLSGKWMSLGTNWTLSAAAYARYDRDVTQYVANVVGKTGSGKKARAFTNELTVAASEVADLGGLATNEFFAAYQNRWKLDPWKKLGKSFTKAKEAVYVPEGFATNETVSLKFAATGKVTVKGKFVKSVAAKTGRITWYTASGSAVLCPQTAPSPDDGSFVGVVFVYFPPKAKTPLVAGYDACVWVRWDGTAKAFEFFDPAERDGE